MNVDSDLANLQRLVSLFHNDPNILGSIELCGASEVPQPFAELLVHEHHMTVTVEAFHSSLVDVEVVQFRNEGSTYAREILLRRQSDSRVVQYGIVELDRAKLSDEVRQRIESRETPLGRVLIEHDVLRQVELVALWKITASAYLAEALEVAAPTIVYGRSAVIHVSNEPAIRLLEIVVPATSGNS
jgi:chorismate-pyruvate lyase